MMKRLLFLAVLLTSISFQSRAQECVNTLININSYMALGGPAYATWNLYSANQTPVANGIAQFSLDHSHYDHAVCLAPGCYGILVSPAFFPASENAFQISITINGSVTSPSNYTVVNGLIGFSFCVPAPVLCPATISSSFIDCNSLLYSVVGAAEGSTTQWTFGDGSSENGGSAADHSYSGNGEYVVTAHYVGSNCPDGVNLASSVNVQCEPAPICPETIYAGQHGEVCLNWIFEIGSASPGENVVWHFGDGSEQTGGHAIQHTYNEPGVYVVTGFYTSTACPNGTTLTQTITVTSCNAVVCPEAIAGHQQGEVCLNWAFEIGSASPGENVVWHFGDGSELADDHAVQHTYQQAGVYVVTAHYTSNSCPNGVYLIYTINVVPCNTSVCPDHIYTAQQGEICLNWIFEIGSASPGENVVWHFGDGTEQVGGHAIQHTYLMAGVYVVTGFYTSTACPNGVMLTQTVIVEDCNSSGCPQFIFSTQYGEVCLNWAFSVGTAALGESVVWHFGDGTEQVGGHAIQHTYSEPGVYTVTAHFTSTACSEGVNLTQTITVQPCNTPDCPDHIYSAQHGEVCLNWIFEIGSAAPGESVIWQFGDGTGQTGGHAIQHTYAQPGIYTVTGHYTSTACPNGVDITQVITVVQCNTPVCPEAIAGHQQGESCNYWVFEIGSAQLGESVIWYFGDGTHESGGHAIQHTFPGPGVYIVTANYSSNACPDGVVLVYTIIVQQCNTVNCPEALFGHQQGESCHHWVFEIGSFVEGEHVVWTFGDGTESVSGGHFVQHDFQSPGIYTVCGYYTSPACPNGVHLCTTVHISNDCGAVDCAMEIVATNLGNGLWQFTATGSPMIIPMHWNFGDGEDMNGGWTVQHQFDQPGDYQVCGSVISEVCEGGFGDCITIQCLETGTCQAVHFGLDSYIAEGGPHYLNWVLTNNDQQVVASGEAGYTLQDPWFDFNTCLPNGCYYLHACGDLPVTNNNFSLFVSSPAVVVNFQPVSNEECHGFNAMISINGGCPGVSECHAAFTPIFTNTAGHIEFSNQSTSGENVTYIWSYGDGQTSDGTSGNVFYNSNGTYTVCLTVISGDCTDTYCHEVVVSNLEEGCQANSVVISISGSYPNSTTVDLLEIILASNGIEFESQDIPLSGEFNFNGTFCIPDGCYTIQMNSLVPLLAQYVQVSISVNGQVINAFSLLQGEENGEMTFGLGMDCTVSVEENLENNDGWLVYPNPASGILNVENAAFSENIQFLITDAFGRQVKQVRSMTQRTQLDVNDLANGLYMLRIVTENGISVRQIVINR